MVRKWKVKQGTGGTTLTLETRPAVRLGGQSGKLRNKEQAGVGERWAGRKESQWMGTSVVWKPPEAGGQGEGALHWYIDGE